MNKSLANESRKQAIHNQYGTDSPCQPNKGLGDVIQSGSYQSLVGRLRNSECTAGGKFLEKWYNEEKTALTSGIITNYHPLEVLPIGLVVAFISSLILKKKSETATEDENSIGKNE